MTIESEISRKRDALNDRLQDLRGSTMRFSHISRAGTIKIDDGEPLAKLNTEITEVEAKIATVDAVINEMDQLYEKVGVRS